MRLSQKLVLFVLLAAVAPLSFGGAWLLREAERELGARLEGEQRALATAAAEATGTQLGATLDALGRTAALIDWPAASDAEVEGGLRLLVGQAPGVVGATLAQAGRERPCLLVDPAVTRAALLGTLPLSALATWGDKGLVALGPVQAGAWLPVAIQVGERGEAAPMLVLGLSLAQLSAWLAAHASDGATLEVIDGDGRIVASSGPHSGVVAASRLAAVRAARDFCPDEAGEQLATAVAPGKLGLAVVVSVPVEVARAPLASLRRTVVAGVALTSALLALAALVFVRRLTQRLDALASTAQAFSRGDLGQRVTVTGGDELSELGATFNAMGAELATSRSKLVTWNDELKARVDLATAELKSAQAQLLEAQKLAALGQLGAGVAHEINNPLVAILGNAQLLLMDRRAEDADFSLLKQIEDGARRCRDITGQLLRFSQRSGEVSLADVDLNHVVERALKAERPRLTQAGVTLSVELAAAPVMVCADGEALEHVLFQLCANARAAMKASADKQLLVRVLPDGLEVRDTGKGIDEATKARMFEPFFTTKDVWSNLGLGLSVSYRIVEQHGGRIEVTSAPGQGASFTVRLKPAGTFQATKHVSGALLT